jgi:hypothetical protein
MTAVGDNLIESTARALLCEQIEATPWFRIRMPHRSNAGRPLSGTSMPTGTYSLPMSLSSCFGLARRTRTQSMNTSEAPKEKAPHKGALRRCRPWGRIGQ